MEGDINNETFAHSKTLASLLYYSDLIETYDQTIIDINGYQIPVDNCCSCFKLVIWLFDSS